MNLKKVIKIFTCTGHSGLSKASIGSLHLINRLYSSSKVINSRGHTVLMTSLFKQLNYAFRRSQSKCTAKIKMLRDDSFTAVDDFKVALLSSMMMMMMKVLETLLF